MFPYRAPALAAGALALVTLAACSSSSSTASGSSASASAPSGSAASSPGTGGSAAAAGKPIKLGFSVLSLSIPGLQDTANSLTAAGQKAGVSVTVANPNFNVQTQVQQIQQWIQLRQVNAIWVIPIAPAAIAPLIKQAQAAHIPMLVDTAPSRAGEPGALPGISFADTNYAKFGQDLGTMLTQCVNQRLGGKSQVIYETDPTGQTSDADTGTALKAEIAQAAGASIVRTVSPGTQLAAQQDVSSALQAVPDANAAVGTNDEAALGAVEAFQAAGKNPATSCIVGGGAAAQSLAAIKAGTLYGGVTFNFQQDVINNVIEIRAMTADPTAVGKVLSVPISVIAPPDSRPMAETAIVSGANRALPGGTTPRTPR
jgi:ABC-type sugar transport system substrate-binding protein